MPDAQHLGDGRQGAIAHEFRTEETLLESRRAGAGTAQQRPGGMRGDVDHAGHQQVRRALDDHGGLVECPRRRARQQVQNTAVAHHQSMMLEDLAGHGHGHDPAGLDA